MAVTFDSDQSGNTTNGTNIPVVLGGGANRLVVMMASQDSTGATAPDSTFNAVAMTRIAEYTGTGRVTSYFQIKEASLPAAGTYNLVSNNWDFDFGYVIWVLHDVDQTTPNDTPTNVSGTATGTGSVTEATQTGDLVLDYIVPFAVEAQTAAGGQSNKIETQCSFFTVAGATAIGAATANTTWTWTTSTNYRHVTVNINAAAGGGGLTSYPLRSRPFPFKPGASRLR